MREPGFWHRPSSWISRLLTPLGAFYGLVAAYRLQREGFDAGIPVLCIGNYHVGGAGKTPAVLALTKLLRDLGETPVVLSRGYGGRLRGPIKVDPGRHAAADVGDEPLMLARTVPVVVARDRIAGVALARSQDASVILMDDGFQNPAIAKDASLIVIDSERGLGNGRVLPAGPLRAPLLPQLERTDALIVVGDGTAAEGVAAAIAARGRPVLTAHLRADDASVLALRGKRALAFAGIGDPGRFFRTLRACGIEVVVERAFADHHPFSQAEIETLLGQAKRDALMLVTTEKDLARLQSAGGLPCWARDIMAFRVTLEFDDGAKLRTFVTDRLFQARDKKFRRATSALNSRRPGERRDP
jgi:tetraacyldisaccharide 4'-kinase